MARVRPLQGQRAPPSSVREQIMSRPNENAVEVKALSVRPPWSEWIADGIKQVENRTWQPPNNWRGTLAIHAGKTLDWDGFWFGSRLGHCLDDTEVARGEFIAVVNLVAVHRAGAVHCGEQCREWGAPDCWHWMLADARRIVSIEWRGRLGLFAPPIDVIEQVTALAAAARPGRRRRDR
ncbi:ASCH domain-containing protein [Solihabitans fulvus]|uniref:ASCH domain-containing protein n=1 Tax=Solihabitans fulvus TaxID=1892852 RepID=A0A5B2W8G3_9PSEU|nr:ASCH domain-containing protein [Solihabitans fulvus]